MIVVMAPFKRLSILAAILSMHVWRAEALRTLYFLFKFQCIALLLGVLARIG